MLTTFYSQKITKQQFDSIQSNWKNISEIEEEIDILDTPKNRMKMDLRVPILLNGNRFHMNVNCFILGLENDSSIHLKVLGSNFKPIMVSILAASPLSLVVGMLFLKLYLIILSLPLFASFVYFNYLKKIKSTCKSFIEQLLKTI